MWELLLQAGDDHRNITATDIDSAPDNVAGTLPSVPVSIDALQSTLARLGNENAELKQQLDKAVRKQRTVDILDSLIEPMARRSFNFMCAYCGAVGTLVTLHGFKVRSFQLPDTVLQFLVGSTAVTVIGLVGMVLTGIFIGARSSVKD